MDSQKETILKIFKSGKSMSSIQGAMIGIIQTTNRINELMRDGHSIVGEWHTSNSGKRFKRYYMPAFYLTS